MSYRKSDFISLGRERKIVLILDKIVNFFILISLIPVLLYGFYGIWDARQVYSSADSEKYETYRPTENDLSFDELRKINPEVFGWLTLKDTHIDYPLVHSDNNSKYVNTDVKGNFSLSGSIFLDYRNKKDFSDLNNVIYGHHMEKKTMFGELEEFKDRAYFDVHKEGEIYYSGEWHKVEFFAFLQADAYDPYLYDVSLSGKKHQEKYLQYIKAHSLQYRQIKFEKEEHLLVLSTCTSDSTNGRHLLVGRITETLQKSSKGEK